MLSVSIRSTAVALGVALASPMAGLTTAHAQGSVLSVDARAVESFSGMYAQYLAAAQSGNYDDADRVANELIRSAAGTKLAALRAAVENGSVDRSKLVGLLASPATEDAAGRLELRILDALAEPIKGDYADFAHFTRIARPDLAVAFANKLAKNADPLVLLHAVENSRYSDKPIYEASQIEGLGEASAQLAEMIESAELARAAEPDRIRGNIRRLSEGSTAFAVGVDRLRAAGSHSAPYFLEALSDPDRIAEQPNVRQAMIDLGRPLVLPLAAAIGGVETETATDLGFILGKIGYPEAAPAIKARLAAGEMSGQAEGILTNALSTLLAELELPADASLAAVCLAVGERYYAAGTRGEILGGVDEATGQGLLWGWAGETVRSLPVPAEVYADVLALQLSMQALAADEASDQALSLFLKSNFRRENRLPQGATDRSYPDSMAAASFYATMSGAGRLLDVLDVALTDGDSELALDAIAALSKTTATHVIAAAGPDQPLQRALNDMNRQVRFDAALALANSRPGTSFDGATRVVPVLSEAVRQGNKPIAVIIAGDQDAANKLAATAEAAGMMAITAGSINDVNTALASSPGADLIVSAGSVTDIGYVAEAASSNYRLSAAPLIAVVSEESLSIAEPIADKNPRLTAVTESGLDAALAMANAQPMAAAEADAYALTALDKLLVVSLSSDVFDIADAVPALIAALGDERNQVAIGAAKVLATVSSDTAQRALAGAALQSSGSLKLTFLGNLAQSATQHGNLLVSDQVEGITALITSDNADLAEAASTVHGALALPTQSVVKLLTQ